MNVSADVVKIRGRLGRHIRFYPDDIEGIEVLRRELAVAVAEARVRQAIEATPLTQSQRNRLAALVLEGAER